MLRGQGDEFITEGDFADREAELLVGGAISLLEAEPDFVFRGRDGMEARSTNSR